MVRRPPVRDDLALHPSYHSPQVDVEVRLNTNEAPEPPPPGFREALREELDRIEWHRYPDRSAQALREAIGAQHGVPAAQVFVANGSNEVLQTLCLTYGGPGRVAATFEPTYALHTHIPKITSTPSVSGQRADDFTLDMDAVRRVLTEHQPTITFLCSPNNPTGMVETEETVRAVADRRRGTHRRHPHVLQDVVDGRGPARLPDRAVVAGGRAVRGGPAVPPRLVQAGRRPGGAALRAGDARPRRPARGGAGPGGRVPRRPAGDHVAVGGEEVWKRLLDHSVLVRNCATWPGLDGCLRITLGTPAENDRFLSALTTVMEDR